ncbi:hypothetical protein KL919_000336 [Ogataea angusta]|nr:hypothetical protein KL909_000980 [Ogataea angusta]KAG7864308.1 hypothetical protein KL919_000336 [Ogataea angusta]
MNQLLAIQPAATGLITTPAIATLRHGTRTTNPIIYNVLTDRPTISSSLPVNLKKTPQLNTTVIRRGTPLTIHLSDDQPDGRGIDLLDAAQTARYPRHSRHRVQVAAAHILRRAAVALPEEQPGQQMVFRPVHQQLLHSQHQLEIIF